MITEPGGSPTAAAEPARLVEVQAAAALEVSSRRWAAANAVLRQERNEAQEQRDASRERAEGLERAHDALSRTLSEARAALAAVAKELDGSAPKPEHMPHGYPDLAIGVQQLKHELAEARGQRNEARAELMRDRGEAILQVAAVGHDSIAKEWNNDARRQLAAQSATLAVRTGQLKAAREHTDAAEERHARLAGEVERIADDLDADFSANSEAEDSWRISYRDRLRALAATAPQTAPAQPAALEVSSCDVTVWDGPYSMRCGRFMPRGECITHGKPRIEPTPADPGSVRETGEAPTVLWDGRTPPWVWLARSLRERGIMTDLFEGFGEVAAKALTEIDRLRSARTAGDEHLQALNRLADVLDPNHVTLPDQPTPAQTVDYALMILEDRAALVDRLIAERDTVIAERNARSSVLKDVIEQREQAYRARDRAEAERDEADGERAIVTAHAQTLADDLAEARREAERLRGEVGKIVQDWAGEPDHDWATQSRFIGRLGALLDAGSSDTTGGEPA